MINSFGGKQFDAINSTQVGKYQADSFERDALGYVNQLKAQWDEEEVFLTDRIYYLMRNVLRKARKFYYGIFDNPRDELTGELKTWIPLTAWQVDNVVKSIDLDTKDILIRPGNPNAIGTTHIIRAIILDTLDKIGFGQLLNDATFVMGRDGTAVVRTDDFYDEKTKRRYIKSRLVNLLNFWIDPAADTIQDSSAVVERIVMSSAEVKNMSDVWMNTQYIPMSYNVPNIPDTWGGTKGGEPYTEIWELWGKIKKSWITKKIEDDNTWIEGHIITSGLGSGNIVHLIRENPREDGIRPYEEVWYKRVDGRWFGRGISEMLFGLQEYVNTVVNIRKANNLVLQNGIFLVRKGAPVTADMISSISAGGAIPVSDIDRDIKQLNVQDYRPSSYADEDRIYSYTDRLTGSFDVNRGEAGRASVSATATLTQDRNIRDTFVLVQENIGFFIERLIRRQYIPLLKKIMKTGDMIHITGDTDTITQIDEAILDHYSNLYVADYAAKTGFAPEPGDLENFRLQEAKKLKKMGNDRFTTYFSKIFDADTDIKIDITDERFNRVVAVQALERLLTVFSNLPVETTLNTDAVIGEILNYMGIRGEFFTRKPQVPAISAQASQFGRAFKEPMRADLGAVTEFENAAGMPATGQVAGGINGGLPQGVNY